MELANRRFIYIEVPVNQLIDVSMLVDRFVKKMKTRMFTVTSEWASCTDALQSQSRGDIEIYFAIGSQRHLIDFHNTVGVFGPEEWIVIDLDDEELADEYSSHQDRWFNPLSYEEFVTACRPPVVCNKTNMSIKKALDRVTELSHTLRSAKTIDKSSSSCEAERASLSEVGKY
jgi:hypothetical protein